MKDGIRKETGWGNTRIGGTLASQWGRATRLLGYGIAILLLGGISLRWVTSPRVSSGEIQSTIAAVPPLTGSPNKDLPPPMKERSNGDPGSNPRPDSPQDQLEVSIFEQFNQWIENYLANRDTTGGGDIIERGQQLALLRQAELRTMIRRDPEKAIQWAIPKRQRYRLPERIVGQLEELISGKGHLTVIATVPEGAPDSKQNAVERFITLRGQRYEAYVYGWRTTQTTQSNLPIQGIAVDDLLAVREDPVRVVEEGEWIDPRPALGNPDGLCPISANPVNPMVIVDVGGEMHQLCSSEHIQELSAIIRGQAKTSTQVGEAAWTQGTKSVLFMRVSFPDYPAESISMTAAYEMMEQVNHFFDSNSYGITELQATVTSLLTLPHEREWYRNNTMDLLDDARKAATAQGFIQTDYDLDCVHGGPLGQLNQALVGGKGAWMSSLNAGVACHEFGHNLGLYHANAWVTSDGSILGSGRNAEYGNVFDTMGNGISAGYAFNAFEKYLLNWLPEKAIRFGLSNGTYRLHPIDKAHLEDGQYQAIRITKDDGPDYWLEVREQSRGSSQLENGILLLWSPWAQSNGGTQLLNVNPQQPGQFALSFRQPFYDLDLGLKITPLHFAPEEPSAVDLRINQVVYIPIELSQNGAGQPSYSKEVIIPETGAYWIWARVPDLGNKIQAVDIAVTDEEGHQGVVNPSRIPDPDGWVLLDSPESNWQATPQVFKFRQGQQKIQVVLNSQETIIDQLLITNDESTNLPPVFTPIADQTLLTGTSHTIRFHCVCIGYSPSNTTLQVNSETPAFIAATNLVLESHGSEHRLTLPLTQVGRGQITLSAVDPAGRIARQSFWVAAVGYLQTEIRAAAPGSTILLSEGDQYDNVVVDRDLIIEGVQTSKTILDGRHTGTTLTIQSNCTVILKNLTILNGRESTIRNFGSLRIQSCEITHQPPSRGRGILNHGNLVIEDSVIQNNHGVRGCGLENLGQALVQQCTLVNNLADTSAGGILNQKGGRLECVNSCFANNRALGGNGGGIVNRGEATLVNCTLYNNATTTWNSEEPGRDRPCGGGIANHGYLQVYNSTLCTNQSDWEGGGLYNRGAVRIANTIIAGNISLGSSASDCYGAIQSEGHNLIQSAAGSTFAGNSPGDIFGLDPRLGPLERQGTQTYCIPLLPDSPAINGGNCSTSPATDQRGVARPVGEECDIGAFEYQTESIIIQTAPGDHQPALAPSGW